MTRKMFAVVLAAAGALLSACTGGDGQAAASGSSAPASSAPAAPYTACDSVDLSVLSATYALSDLSCTPQGDAPNAVGGKSYSAVFAQPASQPTAQITVNFSVGGAGTEEVVLDNYPLEHPERNAIAVDDLGSGAYYYLGNEAVLVLVSGKPVGPDCAFVEIRSFPGESPEILSHLKDLMADVLDRVTAMPV